MSYWRLTYAVLLLTAAIAFAFSLLVHLDVRARSKRAKISTWTTPMSGT